MSHGLQDCPSCGGYLKPLDSESAVCRSCGKISQVPRMRLTSAASSLFGGEFAAGNPLLGPGFEQSTGVAASDGAALLAGDALA